eukprot:NODE_965_length_1348_cov_873.511162_g801_i0.p1 GENE.NODE_965_length_1348_cov_873.511162_g801_i0~~NODE_965_length_1348_cov_873.511162_g801_i0.p1  ORF type:complete len:411 (+),score=115.53 NODE_965_length_1348_cov_873.511162_g801_i0:33-1235(+)
MGDITKSGNVPVTTKATLGMTYSVKGYKKLNTASGWQHYGGAWGYSRGSERGSAVATKVGNLVVLQGLLGGGRLGVMVTLPKEMRPANTLVFNGDSNGSASRVDVRADGNVVYMGGQAGSYTSLCGIVFTAGSPQQKLKPMHGAKNFGAGNSGPRYEDLGVSKAGKYVALSGMLNTGAMKIGQPICRLPEGARPAGRQKFVLPNSSDGQTKRGNAICIDVFPDGRVVHDGRPPLHWTSLSGINFNSGVGGDIGDVASGFAGPQDIDDNGGDKLLKKGNADMSKCHQNVCRQVDKLRKSYKDCKKTTKGNLVTLKSRKKGHLRCVVNKGNEAGKLRAQILELQNRLKAIESQKKTCSKDADKDEKEIKKVKTHHEKCKTRLLREEGNYKKFNCGGNWRDAK